MDRWLGDFHRGVRALSAHDASTAVMCFSRAVQRCPVSKANDLTRLLYYLGIALRKAGYSSSAIRSWVASQKMKKRKHTRTLLDRYCNGYGMAKQSCEDQDDWQAFYSIQLIRYLRGFNKRTLTSRSEQAMLKEIIWESWSKLKASGVLEDHTAQEKCEIFRKTQIDFPLFYHSRISDPVVAVNFAAGRKVKAEDDCPCGSGLPYHCCCGRTPGEDELAIGLF